jgi:predicted phosphoadenosine phosphosulfate sulfurtransferase
MIKNGDKNVLDATMDRIKLIFDDFENVLVAFSCGKDSGVMLSLAYKYAKENDLLHKLSVYYMDYEAGYKYTDEYAYRVFSELDIPKKYWLCLPISAACSVSMYEPRWIPWDKDKEDIWVREMPKLDCVVNEDNCPYEFAKGTKGFDGRIQFAEWFSEEYGKTAVLIGIRAEESLTRQSIFTSQHRRYAHKGLRYSKVVSEDVINFYPIYDWETEDIWKANYQFDFDYNKIYDLYYQAGLTIDQMRVASPFHQCGQNDLKLYRVIDPHNWGKMVGRVNGCNFGGIYGGTSGMAWKTISKPSHFTWEQYANFLISTLPENTKKKFVEHLKRLQDSWSEKGYGRNPEVIAQMEKEGIELEKTGEVSNLCTKPKHYEIVKIKSGFPEETKIQNFRRCPSWKAVCITIMKNDFTLTYMGCSRTKDDNLKKQKALKRYTKIKNKKS